MPLTVMVAGQPAPIEQSWLLLLGPCGPPPVKSMVHETGWNGGALTVMVVISVCATYNRGRELRCGWPLMVTTPKLILLMMRVIGGTVGWGEGGLGGGGADGMTL